MSELTPYLTFLGGAVVSALALIGVIFTARKSSESSSENNIYKRVESLEGRVDRLEKENETFRVAQGSFIDYVEALLQYITAGSKGPKPVIPFRLRDLIDRAYWDEDHDRPSD